MAHHRVATLLQHLQPADYTQFSACSSKVEDGKPVLVLENKATGEKWDLNTPNIQTSQASNIMDAPASSFVLLQTRPTEDSLTVLDNRTGKTFVVKITDNSVKSSDFSQIQAPGMDTGLRCYDPAYTNTAVARSQICYIDGDNGILEYRGYPIEELAEKSTYLEVAYLLIYGTLPIKSEMDTWSHMVSRHTFLHQNLIGLMHSFNYDAHPMGMFISAFGAMSTFHPEANPSLQTNDLYTKTEDASGVKDIQIFRILGKASTVAAAAYRHRIGRDYNLPQNHLSYTANFLYMMDHLNEPDYTPDPTLAKALDIMFILHADHELNCSTAAMRHIGSSNVDPYSAIAGAAAALYGPLHGGACEAVLRMLEIIGTKENVPAFLEGVKKKERKLMGFGHRVYKNYDPRARIIKETAYKVFEVCGKEEMIDIAISLEEAALNDPFFKSRQLYPNVDFYSGLIYKAMGFPTDFFPVLFAIPRVAGWLAHWKEQTEDTSAKIWRPRQIYTGPRKVNYIPLDYRTQDPTKKQVYTYISQNTKRSRVNRLPK